MEKISLFLKQFGWIIVIGVVGGGILAYGMWGQLLPKKPIVEIIKGSEAKNNIDQIMMDVEGAVEKPGVYTLPASSRIGDALVVAGGLSASADREWVAKTLNLAEPIKDGGKIFIPDKNEGNQTVVVGAKTVASADGKVNINSASITELDGLVGIGEVRAKTIIDNRPYGSTDELVSKAKIPQIVYDKIKDQVSVY